MSDELILRLRLEGQAAVDAGLDLTAYKLDALGRAASDLLPQQQELSQQWKQDADTLRTQTLLLRDLSDALDGVATSARRIRPLGLAALGRSREFGIGGPHARRIGGQPSTARRRGDERGASALSGGSARRGGAGASVPGPSGLDAAARSAARAYGRTFARTLGHTGSFLRAGRVAGRALTASTAATAAAQAPRSFAARNRQWAAVGARTGGVIGVTAGGQAAGATAITFAMQLSPALGSVQRVIGMAAYGVGTQFGLQAGQAAAAAFVVAFSQGIGGAGGKLVGGGTVSGNAGKDDDPGFFDKLVGAGGDVLGFGAGVVDGTLGHVAPALGWIEELAGGSDNVARFLGGGSALSTGLRAVGGAADILDWGKFAKSGRDFATGNGSLADFFGATLGVTPIISQGLEANDLFGHVMNFIMKREDPSPGGFLGDMQADFTYQLNRFLGGFGYRAGGGIVRPGEISIVGERGPEIVRLPAGSNVMPANRTREVLERASAVPSQTPRRRRDLHIHQHLNGREIARATLRNIDDEEQWGRR